MRDRVRTLRRAVAPVAVVLLLALVSVILNERGLRSRAALVGAFVGMTAITAVVCVSSQRGQRENYETLSRESV